MHRLEGFVAAGLSERLRGVDPDERRAACTFMRGAVLYADIKNYTPLAETLCRQDGGIEVLGKILDRALRGHVAAVHQTKGEIACFAGDAFIAYWEATDPADVSDALQRAQRCAQLLHTGSASTNVSPWITLPALHVGVAAGRMWAARLVAEEHRHLLLAGPAVRHACAAARAARMAGETVTAPADEGASPPTFGGSAAAQSASGIGDDAIGSVSSWVTTQVNPRMRDYSREGYEEWVADQRNICALFVRIDGLDESAANSLDRHQDVVTSLREALRPYKAPPGTLLVDDKGLVFTLCFGVPHDALGNDARRAVRTGSAIQKELTRVGAKCSIGVVSGPGVCMPIGSFQRRHYWSVGRFMHLAARLMEAADSEMLCTRDIEQEVRDIATLSPRSLVLKGIDKPVRVFRVDNVTAVDDPERLFGRENEQAFLNRSLDHMDSGRGAVVWMTGEAGLGKTALVSYLRQAASRRTTRFLLGGAGSTERDVPYAPWRAIFASMLQDGPLPTPASPEARLKRLGDLRHPQLAPLVNAVVPGFLEDTAVVRSLAGQTRVDATLNVLSDLIVTHATRQFVLVLEDCHWMDSASWRLLLRVTQDYPQALVVLTSRPVPSFEELAALRQLDRFAEMKLSPLHDRAITMLVQNVVSAEATSQELIEEITQRSDGNPLFAREYALLLTAHGSQPHSPGRRALHGSREHDGVPITVQKLIESRLDRLSVEEQLALKGASVIGDRFSPALLEQVYAGREPLQSILSHLANNQLIVREGTEEPTFAFQHALIREVTYHQLTVEQRTRLHRRLAEHLEQAYQAELRPHFASLAHHWSLADAPRPTITYSDLAASQALAAGAFEEAGRLLSVCIQLARHGDHGVTTSDRIRWHRQVADARQGMGHVEARSAAAHEALRLAGRARAHRLPALVAQAARQLATMLVRRIVPSWGVPASAAEAMDVARAYRHSAQVCYFNNDMVGTICDSLCAVATASALPPSAVLAGASTELGGILSIGGLRRTGERILQRAIAIAEMAGDQAAQAHAHMVSCLYLVGMGDWAPAERSAQRCQALCEPLDDRVNWTNAQAVRFWMYHYRSHQAAALEAARSLHDRAVETGNRQHRAWAFRYLALCALRADEPRQATTHLQTALEYLGETAAHSERVSTLGILALTQLRTGDPWSARATAKTGLAQILQARRPTAHSTLEGYSALTTVAIDAWNETQSSEWKRAIGLCIRVLARYRKSFPVGEPRYRLSKGDYCRASGRSRAALRHYRRCEAAALRLGMPWELARAREALQSLSGAGSS